MTRITKEQTPVPLLSEDTPKSIYRTRNMVQLCRQTLTKAAGFIPWWLLFLPKKKLVSTEEERASGYLHACRKKVLVAVSEEITETQKYITAAVSTVLVFLFALACRNTRNYRGSPPLLRWKGLNLFSSQDIHTSPDHSIFSPTLLSLKSLYW